MERIHKFLNLPPAEQFLLVKSLALLAAIRIGLWSLPFRTLRRLLTHLTRTNPRLLGADQPPIDRICWVVSAASRYVFRATCLTQALATQALLRRRGHPACLRIGVAKGEKERLDAHAWVESRGQIVIGDSADLSRFAPLPPLEKER